MGKDYTKNIPYQRSSTLNFDSSYSEQERFPRKFEVELREVEICGKRMIRTFLNNTRIGNDLTDNAYIPDGYRFHDVLHLAFVAILGWSPVIRKLINKKRRSNCLVDEVEDGGRAQVIDEVICAMIFSYAREHNWLENITKIDSALLQQIRSIAVTVEAGKCSVDEWQNAILTGFKVWRETVKNNGGYMSVDLDNKTFEYLHPSASY